MDSIGRWLRRTSACMPRSDVTLVLHQFRHCASSAALPNTASAESQSSVPLIMLAAIQQQVGAVGVEIDENVTFSRGCGARRFRYWRGALTSCVDALRGGINSKPNGNAIAQYENSCLSICLAAMNVATRLHQKLGRRLRARVHRHLSKRQHPLRTGLLKPSCLPSARQR